MTSKDKNWKEIAPAGVCSKSSKSFLTGDWKTYTPIRDVKKCVKCLTCVIFCPDVAIKWVPDKKDIEFDMNYCKGCGICANECPTKAITMSLE
jgi:2-oxoacid:acceptor oxidoreductase delta subunit (pyruvate/2-ketoisovalerate family)